MALFDENTTNNPHMQIGYPTLLPGRGYTGLEKPARGLFNMFKTWVKGAPKSISTADKVAAGAGAIGGVALGYDDDHKQYVRETLRDAGIEFPRGINQRGDSIYDRRHPTDYILRTIFNKH